MNEDGVDRDHVDDLIERLDESLRRGEWPEAAFKVEWEGLTEAEKNDYMALSKQQLAQRKEKLEAINADNRILRVLALYEYDVIDKREFLRMIRLVVK